MKIVFFGSDDFAGESLQSLLAEKFSVVACVTQPDRPSGRGLQIIASPIKTIACESNIPVFQPDHLNEELFLSQMRRLGADIFVVIAYGKILPPVVLKIPKVLCMNVHGSLLPKYRGAAPVNWAIMNGDIETGFSIIKMSPKMDAGEIIVQEKMLIGHDETSQSLRGRMAKASAQCLCRTIQQIAAGQLTLTPQDENTVTLAPKLTKELGRIDWNRSAQEIHNLIRGLVPWPAGYTQYHGKLLKILKTTVMNQSASQLPGTVINITKQGIFVATGKNILVLEHVHPESGKPIAAHAFALGQRLQIGSSFK
ncbi:MAG: methionyl-tRNA formyltransferase [Candidatus Omnitrophica bacterium]|nr:methionyl-tRNA formyltransferase [Candidatus Omnitrophota bacterium]